MHWLLYTASREQFMRWSQRTGPICRLFSYIYPARNPELLKQLQARKLTVIGAPHCVPHSPPPKECTLFDAMWSGDPVDCGWPAESEVVCARHGLHSANAEVRPAPVHLGR